MYRVDVKEQVLEQNKRCTTERNTIKCLLGSGGLRENLTKIRSWKASVKKFKFSSHLPIKKTIRMTIVGVRF